MSNNALYIIEAAAALAVFWIVAACEAGASLWWMAAAFAAIAVFDRCNAAIEQQEASHARRH